MLGGIFMEVVVLHRSVDVGAWYMDGSFVWTPVAVSNKLSSRWWVVDGGPRRRRTMLAQQGWT